jgi:predicted phosphodiesterase
MRIFALSDIHTDHEHNRRWVAGLSHADYSEDVLILAGDVSDTLSRLAWTLTEFAQRFAQVLYVPGNHDLWVLRDRTLADSLEKYQRVCAVAADSGGSMQPWQRPNLIVMPLLGWYDYSFGEPGAELRQAWMDFHACRWPQGWTAAHITAHFAALNAPMPPPISSSGKIITFSHFLPRIDVMPSFIPQEKRFIYPVLGSSQLDVQLRRLGSTLHIYGHSHVNQRIDIDGVTYINNAFGYPQETRISAKQLLCILDA